MSRVEVLKTWKLFIGGGFPRTESGRTLVLEGSGGRVVAHCCRASRKDLRNAIESARGSLSGWWGRDAYNRGQILYRLAEMADHGVDRACDKPTSGEQSLAARLYPAAWRPPADFGRDKPPLRQRCEPRPAER